MATTKKTPKKAAKPAASKPAASQKSPTPQAPNKWINRLLGLSAFAGIFVFVGLYNWEIGLLLLGLTVTVGGFALILRNATTLVPAEATAAAGATGGAAATADNIFERFRSQHKLPPSKERQTSPPPQAKPLNEVPAEPLGDDDPLGAALQSKAAAPEPEPASPFDDMLSNAEPEPEPEPQVVAPPPPAPPKPKVKPEPPAPEPKPQAAAPAPQATPEPEATPEPLPPTEPPTKPLATVTAAAAATRPAAERPPEPPAPAAEPEPPAEPPVVPELVELSEDDLFGDEDDDDLFADARFTLPAEEPSRLPETTPPMPAGPSVPEPRSSTPKSRSREERLEDAESLLRSAKRAFQAQQLDEARINLESYRSLLKRLRAQPSSEALELQTQISLMQGDTQQAQASIGEIRSGGESSNQAESLKLMEDLAASLEKKQAYKEVQPILRELLEVYEGQKQWREADGIYERLTSVLEALGAEEELIALLKQHRELKKLLQDRPGESRLLDRLGTLSHQRGDLEATRQYYEENLKLRAERV